MLESYLLSLAASSPHFFLAVAAALPLALPAPVALAPLPLLLVRVQSLPYFDACAGVLAGVVLP